MGRLVNLQNLILSHNNITALPLALGTLFRLENLEITNNPIISPPVGVLQRSTPEIISYLRDRMARKCKPGCLLSVSRCRSSPAPSKALLDYRRAQSAWRRPLFRVLLQCFGRIVRIAGRMCCGTLSY